MNIGKVADLSSLVTTKPSLQDLISFIERFNCVFAEQVLLRDLARQRGLLIMTS